METIKDLEKEISKTEMTIIDLKMQCEVMKEIWKGCEYDYILECEKAKLQILKDVIEVIDNGIKHYNTEYNKADWVLGCIQSLKELKQKIMGVNHDNEVQK